MTASTISVADRTEPRETFYRRSASAALAAARERGVR